VNPVDAFRNRKAIELQLKLASLPVELEAWRLKAQSHKPLAKSHSQLERVTFRVEGFQKKVEGELKAAQDNGELWTRAESVEKKALLVHMIWDFYRTRFSLRIVEPFDRYLALADAFARACYEPVYRMLCKVPGDQLCPAPLVTFNDQISPWATPPEPVELESQAGPFTAAQFKQAVESMPLALVGVPWSYLTYLPHMALIAHEVGHAVERDCKISISDALDPLAPEDPERKPAWQAWGREVFADIFGCWMAGPAFVWALADYLSSERDNIAKQIRPQRNGDWTTYPTAPLRIRLGCAVLKERGFGQESKELWDAWQSAYPEDQLSEFERDFEDVAARLAAAARLEEVDPLFLFTAQNFQTASRDAALLTARAKLVAEPRIPQCYVTAARLLINRGLGNAEFAAAWSSLVEHHVTTQSPALAGPNAAEPAVDPDEERRLGGMIDDLLVTP
jgi:hypothetical protein